MFLQKVDVQQQSDLPVEVQGLGLSFCSMERRTLKADFVRLVGRHKARSQANSSFFWALRSVSFIVNQGDRLAVIGDNGAGKSTLLRVIAGIYPPSEGVVSCHGNVYPLFQMGMGFNFEVSAEENAILALGFYGLSRKEVKPLLDGIFDFAELQQFRHQPLKTYSNGMVTRLAFTVSTTINPDILILDEVLAGGDIRWMPKALSRIENKMDSARCIIMVSHSMEMVRKYCNRFLWLSKGQIKALGGPDVVDQYVAWDAAT